MMLDEFLVKAKVNTYASVGEGGERNLDDGSKELVYEESGWKYRDRYFGFNPFIGEEVVWKDGKVIWAMNYYGRLISDKVLGKEVYEFLKKALQKIKKARPFRGPTEFIEGEWTYQDESEGMLDGFEGVEMIFYRREKVYELRYHGGVTKK